MIKVIKIPTALKANNLTIDSKAMAATIPSCRSVASIWRVPNKIEKAAITMATEKALSFHIEVTLCSWIISKSG